MKGKRLMLVVTVVVCVVGGAANQAVAACRVIALSAPDGRPSRGAAIRNGTVVGTIDDGSSPNVASVLDRSLRWRPVGREGSVGRDLDGLGRVVGHASPEGETLHAWLWDGGQDHDLGTLGEGRDSTATAINQRGDIVGYSQIGRSNVSPYHAFLIRDGVMQDLGSPAGFDSIANDVADDGTIVGFYSLVNGGVVAFRLKDRGFEILPSLAGNAEANAINDRGEIVGVSSTDTGERHAYVTDGSSAHDLGTLGGTSSLGLDINDNGDVVGSSELPDGTLHAFVVPHGGAMIDLQEIADPDGVILHEARAIDDEGRIVANGRRFSGGDIAYLLDGCY